MEKKQTISLDFKNMHLEVISRTTVNSTFFKIKVLNKRLLLVIFGLQNKLSVNNFKSLLLLHCKKALRCSLH